jgi:hypothetical protein
MPYNCSARHGPTCNAYMNRCIYSFIQITQEYDEISQEQHCIFIPFVIETYGGLGKKAQDFLNELSIFAIDHALIKSRFDIVNGLRYAIACSVQRGNALIASAGYANALRVFRDRA